MSDRRTVVCVDDNQDLRDNLREILEDAGYQVRVAGSCSEGLEAARAGLDVALVDVRLPDGDGVALARRLRELAPDAQVIMLTGFATIESAVAAVRASAWAYLVKPCSTPDLLIAVEQAVKQIEHLEEKRSLVRRARLAEKLAAIGTLTAGLSHEVKNPLNAAALQLTVLERRIGRLPEKERGDLEGPLRLVKDEVARLNRILEEFLDFARPREIEKTPVDLAALVGRVVELIAPQAARDGIRLESSAPTELVIAGDSGRLNQVLVNLLLNAIQATPHGGLVRVALDREPDAAVIVVEDSGPGIPEDIVSRIFEPFFTTKEAGSGLGLPLVHGAVDQHGGSVTVERSAAVGGARFLIRLPIA